MHEEPLASRMTIKRSRRVAPRAAPKDLGHIANALQILAREIPPRTSVRQAMAFVAIARFDALNLSVTLAELRDAMGVDAQGMPLLGQSIERTFATFLPPTPDEPEALDWCYQDADPNDRRRKPLRLSSKGRTMADRIVRALRGRGAPV